MQQQLNALLTQPGTTQPPNAPVPFIGKNIYQIFVFFAEMNPLYYHYPGTTLYAVFAKIS